MPARENETESGDTEVLPEPPQAESSEQKQEFTTEGDLPAVASATGAAAVTASELAFDGKDQAPADTSHLDKGMHHWEEYKNSCEAAGKAEKWKDHYRNGHTEAKGWNQPYEHRAVNDFTLKKGYSASEAIQALMKGPTICDYRVALLADEIDEVRSELGDQRFDRLFGSKDEGVDAHIPASQRLRIASDLYTTPLGDQMKALAAEADAKEQRPEEEPAPAMVEAHVEEKPVQVAAQEQDPVVVAQELGMEQRDREIV